MAAPLGLALAPRNRRGILRGDEPLGGSVTRTHRSPEECSHLSTVTVISGAIERVVCEECGHVTIRYESMISGDVQRSNFSRRADRIHDQAGIREGA